jgi:hypothetical protein
MSLALLSSTVADLPFVLREQVVGYAESVRQALPDIFRDAGVKLDQRLADEVVFLAGVRKLHGLVASSYWALDNSAELLDGSAVDRIRIGRHDFSRGGQVHSALRAALEGLESALARENIGDLIKLGYADLVQALAGNGPR